MVGKFENDEAITSIKVQLHTAALSDASSDSDIGVELFGNVQDPESPFGFRLGEVEIDTDGYNDFEWGDTNTYKLPERFYRDRIVNDIRRVVQSIHNAGTMLGHSSCVTEGEHGRRSESIGRQDG
jgi:hypothetical protein